MPRALANKQLRATCSAAEQLLPMNTPGGPEEWGWAYQLGGEEQMVSG